MANSDEYYSVSINTIIDTDNYPVGLHAKSDTEYYIIWTIKLGFNTAVAKIIFDPDSSNCGG